MSGMEVFPGSFPSDTTSLGCSDWVPTEPFSVSTSNGSGHDACATFPLRALCPGVRAKGSLTGHPVNGPERSQHTDCPDCREADVL